MTLGAILLAGGRGRRLGGVDKPLLRVGEARMVDAAVAAARAAGCAPITVVGSDPGLPGVAAVREEPPFGGPVAGIAAALDAWGVEGLAPGRCLLLACDIPSAGAAVRALLAADDGDDGDGALLVAADGRHRLVALLATAALRAAVAALPDRGRDAPLREVLRRLRLREVVDAAAAGADVDTWEDLVVARLRAGRETGMDDRLARVRAWADTLGDRYGLAADDIPIDAILDLARDAAHGVDRPAAPLTTFIAGLVAGRRGADAGQLRAILGELGALAVAAGEGDAAGDGA